ncbi:MAG: hypothetical protein WCH96_12220 [Betaproteobacteria bacterium]
MPRLSKSPIRIQFGLSGWVGIISALAIFVLLVAAIAFVAVGLFVFFLPLLLIAPVIYYFLPHLRPKVDPRSSEATQWESTGQTIIDGEFRVVDPNELEGHAKLLGEDRP